MLTIPVDTMKLVKQLTDANDVRPTVRGVHLYRQGYVAATDANIAFVSNQLPLDAPLDKDYLIQLPKSVSTTSVVNFVVNLKTCQLHAKDKDGNTIGFTPFQILDAPVADFKSVFDKFRPTTQGASSFDPAYLKAMSVFKKGSTVAFKLGEPDSVSLAIGDEGAMLIMPKTHQDRELPGLLR